MVKSETAFVLENANWPVLLVDGSANIRASSKGAKKLFGTVLAGRRGLAQTVWSRENDLTPEQFLAEWNSWADVGLELRFRGKDGATCSYVTQVCPFQLDGEELLLLQLFKPAGAIEPIIETTSQPPTITQTGATEGTAFLEAGLAHKQKLDCAMQLIRTVALDFNNALTSILGHASLLLVKADPKHAFRGSLLEIEKSAQKAAEIAQDLADFSRQEKDSRAQRSGSINDVVRRTVEFFKEAQPESLQWKLHFEPRPFAVKFDEAKIQQAFIKILENSAEALNGFGTVSVTTRNLDLNESMKDGDIRLAPGAYCCIEMQDTGSGIAPEVLPRIFEPFFTTRKESGHRGLGLAWVYGIVTNHGGSVAVKSEVNQGTEVRVYLPAQKRVVEDHAAESLDLTGTETILMIDDEDLILTMGETVLSAFGYQVLTANSGAKALEIFSQRLSDIDLVITDLVMPKMSGREVIEKLRRLRPELQIVCASGLGRPPAGEKEENYLQKPFAAQDLLRKVKQVLTPALKKN